MTNQPFLPPAKLAAASFLLFFVTFSSAIPALAQTTNACGVPVDEEGIPLDDVDLASTVILGTDDINDKQQGMETDDITSGGGGFDLHPLTMGRDVITDFDPARDMLDVGDFARPSDGFATLGSLADIAALSTQTAIDGQTALVIDVDGPFGNSTTTLLGVTVDDLNESNVFFGLEGTSIPPQPVTWASAICVTTNTDCRFVIPGHEVPGSSGQSPLQPPDPCADGGGNGGNGGGGVPTSPLLLSENRFEVQASWATPDGTTGTGMPEKLTDDTGYFWFFDRDNVEMVVKVIDACDAFGHFWVFAGGLTNVEVTAVVTDTQTGATFTFTNPQGTPFAPVQATRAFATCP